MDDLIETDSFITIIDISIVIHLYEMLLLSILYRLYRYAMISNFTNDVNSENSTIGIN